MQLRVRHIARNVLFNWLGTMVNMAVGFFLSPFILHRLGNVAYAVWVLTVSVVGYLGLLDLGMQSSVMRFVSQGHTKGDHQSASEATSAAFWVRLQLSALALVLSGVLAAVFPHVFKIPPQLIGDARASILIIGLTTAVTLSFGVLGGIISALNRYDLQNYAGLVQTSIRVVGIVVVLRSGHGIVAIALCELLGASVSKLTQLVFARHLYPELKIRLGVPKRDTIKKVWSYSAYTFLISIAIQLVYQTDNLVVGAFVSTAAVTFYAIANSLCRYAGQVVTAMSATFMPAASTYESAGDSAGLLRLYTTGTRAMMLVSLPMMLTLILRGSTFIGLWMGPQYGHSSGVVLVLLAIPLIFAFANQTPGAIAFGIEKHKILAVWAVGEGVVNLVLSVILARKYGIYGVALGTFIPNLFSQMIFWPIYTTRLVGIPTSQILLNVWGPVIIASIPFGIASWIEDAYLPVHSIAGFVLQLSAAMLVFVASVSLVFRTYVRAYIWPKVHALFFAEA